MNNSEIKSMITGTIKSNHKGEITGQKLQDVLIAMVNVLGAGYVYIGDATPLTDPNIPDNKVFYLAMEAGTYTNFDNIVVSEPTILYFDTQWHSRSLNGNLPTVARVSDILNGDIIPKIAENLRSWKYNNLLPVDNDFNDTIRTTAGDDPIDTTAGGMLLAIKALANGVPTGITDGIEVVGKEIIYNGKSYKVYTTSGGIDLSALFAAAPNGTGKFLVCGGSSTHAERINASQWRITDPIGRIASPVWTDKQDEVKEGETQTYTHSLNVPGIDNNGMINVLFTTPINTEHSTLNVSLTGAKPIRILGQDLPAGAIKAQSYATLAYDGEVWNIVNLFHPESSFNPAGLVIDMGLASGVKWASRDIDLTKPGGFCDTPFVYEKSFFSWGNIDGHNPMNNSFSGVYNWGSINSQEPWYDGQVYGNTKGATLTSSITTDEEFDAARANLGSPWRMPTAAEFKELFDNCIYIDASGVEISAGTMDKRVTVNGIVGLYLQSKTNGNKLFFACSGLGVGTSWDNRGSGGYYWSASFSSARYARFLYFGSGGVIPQGYYNRRYGCAVRPVQ